MPCVGKQEFEEKLQKKLELAEMKKNLWICYRVEGKMVKPAIRKRTEGLSGMLKRRREEEKRIMLEEKKEEM